MCIKEMPHTATNAMLTLLLRRRQSANEKIKNTTIGITGIIKIKATFSDINNSMLIKKYIAKNVGKK